MEFIRHYNKWPWGNNVIIITNDGCGTATVTFAKGQPSDVGLISDMSVHITHRCEGYGNRLLKECEDEIKRHGLTTAKLYAKLHSVAYHWYKRHGYVEIPEITIFPQCDDDTMCVTMSKAL